MKKLILVLCGNLFSFFIIFGQTPDFKINSYDINADFAGQTGTVGVSLVCNIEVNKISKDMQFIFGSNAEIKSISILKDGISEEVPFRINGKDSLLLAPGESLKPGKKYSLKFDYDFPTGTFNDTVLILDRGHRWYPLVMDQVVPFKISCKTPHRYNVLSDGNLTGIIIDSENTEYIWESKFPVFKVQLMILNSGVFKRSSVGKCDLYYTGIDSLQSKKILDETLKILNYYENNFGNYPYKKLTLCSVTDFPGIDTGSGLLMIGSQSLEYLTKGYFNMLILTISQQWFGAGVFAKYGGTGFSFFTISLPNYLELMYLQNELGEDDYNKQLQQLTENYKDVAGTEKDMPVIDVDFPNTREKAKILYAKGPIILSMVEKEMGREKWLSMFKDLCSTFRGNILTYADFKKYISKYDGSGRTLTLFDNLTTGKGLPKE